MPKKKPDWFYKSREWRRAAEKAKRAAQHTCCVCGAHRNQVRLIVDHIIERKDGGADFEPANLQVLCINCHNRKTAQAKRARQ